MAGVPNPNPETIIIRKTSAVGWSELRPQRYEKEKMMDQELEAEIRSNINPVYEDVRGTESYERKRLLGEIDNLRKAARLIHDRSGMVSGSLEMGECDALCKSVGLEPWKWPIRAASNLEGETP